MSRRFASLVEVNKIIKSKGSKLLAIVEKDGNEILVDRIPLTKEKVRWMCRKCKEDQISIFGGLLKEDRPLLTCRSCTISESRGGTGYDGFVKELESEGWKMLGYKTEYKNTKSLVNVKCDNGHKMATSQNRFSSGHRCKECDNLNRQCHDIENIMLEFSEHGFELLATEYINNSTDMPYICSCNSKSYITYSNFSQNKGCCKECKPSPFASKKIRQKKRETNMKRYGNSQFLNSETGMELIASLYGYPYAMQNPAVCAKSMKNSYSRKEYIFPSGKKIFIQGYEHFALNDLFKEGVSEKDIVTGANIPRISYSFEENEHLYTPDIYIISRNALVEVKSLWVYHKQHDRNLAKFQAASRQYNFELRIYSEKGELLQKREFVVTEIVFH